MMPGRGRLIDMTGLAVEGFLTMVESTFKLDRVDMPRVGVSAT